MGSIPIKYFCANAHSQIMATNQYIRLLICSTQYALNQKRIVQNTVFSMYIKIKLLFPLIAFESIYNSSTQ